MSEPAEHLLANLMVNVDPEGSIPGHAGFPLIMDAPMVKRAVSERDFRGRLYGHKGPVLWTTGAMLEMAEIGSLSAHLKTPPSLSPS